MRLFFSPVYRGAVAHAPLGALLLRNTRALSGYRLEPVRRTSNAAPTPRKCQIPELS